MRLKDAIGEAMRNISSGTSRALSLTLLLSLFTGVLIGTDITLSKHVLEAAKTFRESGSSVIILNSAGRIDGDKCDQLALLPGVHAAGSIRLNEIQLRPAATPNAPVVGYEISTGFLNLMNLPPDAQGGLALSRDASETLAVGTGDQLVLESNAAKVHGVYDWQDDGRRGGFGYAALLPAVSDIGFDECWVDAWPAPNNLDQHLYNAQIPSVDVPKDRPTVSQLNTTLGTSFDGQRMYQERLSALAPWFAFIVSPFIGYFSVRVRRLEHASSLHAGVTKIALSAILAIETSVWVLATTILVLSTMAIGTFGVAPEDRLVILLQGSSIMGMVALGVTIGIFLGVATTRERYLFKYFKSR